jgi:hypothetical protein
MQYIPKVGDDVYVDTSLFVTHGEDDFIGGLCKVCSVSNAGESLSIEVEEDKGASYLWSYLKELQESLKLKFGTERGHKKPDYRKEFNEL